MVVNLFIGLILIAIFSTFIAHGKRKKIWSVLLLMALCILSYLFINNLNSNNHTNFIYQWLPYQDLNADFRISSSLHIQKLITQLIYLLGILISLNIIDKEENFSLNISLLHILSFTSIILMISSNDFFQMMFSSSLLTIIGFYTPQSGQTRQKFFSRSFWPEIICFITLAYIYGISNSISLSQLEIFTPKNHQQNLVLSLILFAIGSKIGLFPFNGTYNYLSNLSFNRLCGIFALSIPIAGLILIAKLHILFTNSAIFDKIIEYWSILSFIIAIINSLFDNNIRKKAISLAQMILIAMFISTYHNPDNIYTILPNGIAIIILSLIMIYTALLTPNDQPKILNTIIKYILFSISSLTIIILFKEFITPQIYLFIALGYLCALGCSLKTAISETSKTQETSQEYNWMHYTILMLVSGVLIFNKFAYLSYSNIYLELFFIISLIFAPTKILTSINQQVWQIDWIDRLYEIVLITPIKTLGKMLLFTFDFMFMERGIMTGIASTYRIICEHCSESQKKVNKAWLYWTLGGIIIFTIYIGIKNYD